MRKGNRKPALTLIHCSGTGPLIRRAATPRRPEGDPALNLLVEQVRLVYKAGDFNARARLRGYIAAMADDARKRAGLK